MSLKLPSAPQHLAVLHYRVPGPGDDPALASQSPLQVHVGHGNSPAYDLLGEAALDQGRVYAAVDL